MQERDGLAYYRLVPRRGRRIILWRALYGLARWMPAGALQDRVARMVGKRLLAARPITEAEYHQWAANQARARRQTGG